MFRYTRRIGICCVPAAGALAVGARAGVPDVFVRHAVQVQMSRRRDCWRCLQMREVVVRVGVCDGVEMWVWFAKTSEVLSGVCDGGGCSFSGPGRSRLPLSAQRVIGSTLEKRSRSVPRYANAWVSFMLKTHAFQLLAIMRFTEP